MWNYKLTKVSYMTRTGNNDQEGGDYKDTMLNDANKQKLQTLIESVVNEVLAEQDVVMDDPLLKVFLEPFTDVIKTANAELQKNLVNIRGNAKSLAKQAAILAIPFLSVEMIDDTHKEAQKQIKQKLGAIDQKYADVYLRNWNAVRNRDVWGIGFLLNPMLGITAKFAMKSPLITLNVLETLTAGGLSPQNAERLAKAKELATKLSKPVSPNYGGGGGDWGGGGGGGWGDYGDGDFGGDDGGGFGESVTHLKEQQSQAQAQSDQQKQLEKLGRFVEAFKNQPDVQAAMSNSKVAQSLKQGALEAVMAAAGPILQAQNYAGITKALGNQMQKFEAEALKGIPEDITPEELQQFKEAMVPEIKNAYRQVLITQLSKQATGDKVADQNLQQVIAQIKKA